MLKFKDGGEGGKSGEGGEGGEGVEGGGDGGEAPSSHPQDIERVASSALILLFWGSA